VGGMRQSYFAGSSREQVKFLWQAECKSDIPSSEGDLMLITARPVLVGAAEQPVLCSLPEHCKLDKVSTGVAIKTGYGLEAPGSIPDSTRFFCSSQSPNRFRNPLRPLSSGYRGLFPWS
jgi:hypothetical protein